MPFSFRLLRLFTAVARQGSVTAAARALGLSQPAVSKGVRTLERQVGTPLLVRTPRGLRPTEAGAALLDHGRVIFAAARAAEDDVRALTGLERGTLRVGGSPTVATYILPRILRAFHARHPAVALKLVCAPSRVVAAQLAERDLDVALTEALVEDPRLTVERWIEDELVPVAAPTHPLAAHASLAAAGRELFVLREPGSGTRDTVLAALARRGIEPARTLTADSTEAIRQIVAEGLGIAIDSAWAVADLVALGRLVVLDIPGLRIRRPMYRLALRAGGESAAARAFGNLIARAAIRRAGLDPWSGQPVPARSGKKAATVVPRPT
jgi:molybdate transport repressor ModE-like protein